MKIESLSLDLETYSEADLTKTGVYPYAEHPSFEILLFGYSVNDGPVEVVDVASGEKVPDEILLALTDGKVKKWSYNCSFERICLSYWLRRNYPEYFQGYGDRDDHMGNYLDPSAWYCSRIWGATLGLPMSLKGIGAVLDLDDQKMDEGADLIRYFCKPCAPTKSNGGRTRNLPSDAPEKWEVFKAYNKRDVEVEMGIKRKLRNYPVPDSVWDEYHLSEQINDRGICADMTLVRNAIKIDEESRNRLFIAMQNLTDLDNPNSVQQLKSWLQENDIDVSDLGKKNVTAMQKENTGTLVGEALSLRLQLAQTSVKKYTAMQNAVCADSRIRGMFSFYGANRTGRFSSKIVQLQNLRQNHLPDLSEARLLVRDCAYDDVSLVYENVPDVLSQLVRTAFVPESGKKFIVADFSAIECRVLSWYAHEQWVLDAFARGEDIYCAVASQMYHCKVEKNGENGELRQKGKQATLSCGYGGGENALVKMGALDSGMKQEELKPLVDAWRAANPNVVKMWHEVDRAARTCIREKTSVETHGLTFGWKSGMMFITLASGRKLAYVKPKIEINKFGSESISYEGIDGTKKWSRLESFGGKICENIVQGTARDILMFAMQTLSKYKICAHVHDEVIIEADMGDSLETVCEEMGRVPPWAPGLILRADGYECPFYQKS